MPWQSKREAEPQRVTWSPHGGEGCWVIASKIAEFWYYTSIPCLMYIIIKYKNIENIKKWSRPLPPGGGGVWYDTPAVNLEPPLVRWHHCVLNKWGDSRPRGQSLLRYQPVCLWYHYTRQLKEMFPSKAKEILWDRKCTSKLGKHLECAWQIRVLPIFSNEKGVSRLWFCQFVILSVRVFFAETGWLPDFAQFRQASSCCRKSRFNRTPLPVYFSLNLPYIIAGKKRRERVWRLGQTQEGAEKKGERSWAEKTRVRGELGQSPSEHRLGQSISPVSFNCSCIGTFWVTRRPVPSQSNSKMLLCSYPIHEKRLTQKSYQCMSSMMQTKTLNFLSASDGSRERDRTRGRTDFWKRRGYEFTNWWSAGVTKLCSWPRLSGSLNLSGTTLIPAAIIDSSLWDRNFELRNRAFVVAASFESCCACLWNRPTEQGSNLPNQRDSVLYQLAVMILSCSLSVS